MLRQGMSRGKGRNAGWKLVKVGMGEMMGGKGAKC